MDVRLAVRIGVPAVAAGALVPAQSVAGAAPKTAASPTQTSPTSQTAVYTGNFADVTLDSTGSYNANVTATITVPAAFTVGSYQCTIGQDPQHGTYHIAVGPHSFINGVTGPIPH